MKIISPAQLKKIKDDPNLFLLDVREIDEVKCTPMKDMPYIHIPMNDISIRLSEIDKEKHIVIFCLSGGRSARICGFLEAEGYKNISNLTGGITAWLQHVTISD